jgi:hypothetical protein
MQSKLSSQTSKWGTTHLFISALEHSTTLSFLLLFLNIGQFDGIIFMGASVNELWGR